MYRASGVICQVRRTAGITQSELAQRAGIAQTTISPYERGSHAPSLRSLRVLVAGAGLRLEVALHDVASEWPLPTTMLGSLISQKLGEPLEAAVALGAKNVRVFGCAIRGEDGPRSDVDLSAEAIPLE